MQFCHASKSLAESVFSSHLFGKRESPISFADPCTNPSPKPPTGRPPLACKHLRWWANHLRIPRGKLCRSLRWHCKRKGESVPQRLGNRIAYKTFSIRVLVIRIYFPALLIGGPRVLSVRRLGL